MASDSGSSVQFRHSALSLGGSDDFTYGQHQTGGQHPMHQGVTEVSPLSAANSSSARKKTAWVLSKGPTTLPDPYDAYRYTSFYNWEAGNSNTKNS